MSNFTKTFLFGLAGATMLATTANAGGLERSNFSAGLLFEEGNYIEGSLGYVMPNITSEVGGFDINPDYAQINVGAKFDVHERFSVAFTSYEPSGAKIDYSTPLGQVLGVDISTRAFAALGKVNYNGFSVYAGPAYYTAEAETNNLLGAGTGIIEHQSDGAFGWIGGIAYERKEIALRVSLTYESGAEFGLPTPAAVGFGLGDNTRAAIPEAVTLNFQSGVAPGTLVFGSIRHAWHSNANIIIGPAQISNFSDSTTYTLGVGRKLTEKLDASISAAYEGSSGEPSTFAPTGSRFTLSLGGKYKATEKVSISAGISHSWLGDNETLPANGSLPFQDNTAWVVGTKVGINF